MKIFDNIKKRIIESKKNFYMLFSDDSYIINIIVGYIKLDFSNKEKLEVKTSKISYSANNSTIQSIEKALSNHEIFDKHKFFEIKFGKNSGELVRNFIFFYRKINSSNKNSIVLILPLSEYSYFVNHDNLIGNINNQIEIIRSKIELNDLVAFVIEKVNKFNLKIEKEAILFFCRHYNFDITVLNSELDIIKHSFSRYENITINDLINYLNYNELYGMDNFKMSLLKNSHDISKKIFKKFKSSGVNILFLFTAMVNFIRKIENSKFYNFREFQCMNNLNGQVNNFGERYNHEFIKSMVRESFLLDKKIKGREYSVDLWVDLEIFFLKLINQGE